LSVDDSANRDFYGQALKLQDIVAHPARDLRVPAVASTWTDRLRELGRSPAASDRDMPRAGDDSESRAIARESSRGADAPSGTYAPPLGFNGKLVSVRELAEHAKSHRGEEVMVAASIESLYSRSVFVLDDDPLLRTNQQVVVVAPNLLGPLTDNMEVAVVGDVISFRREDVEKRFPGYRLDVPDDVAKSLENMPAILATSIRTRAGQELVDYRGSH